MRKTNRIIVVMFMLVLWLSGCGSSEETGEYSTKAYEVAEEETFLVTNPTAEYVMAALHQLDSITGIEQDPDPSKESLNFSKGGECVARIYFTSSLVDQSSFGEEESTLEKGTSAGGSIDIYDNVEDAIARDKYLEGFDDSWLLDSGSHTVVGTIVIRTSEKLDENVQKELTNSIIDSLTSGEITDEVIELSLKEIAEDEANRLKVIEEKKAAEKAAKEAEKAAKEAEKAAKAIEAAKIKVGTDSKDFIDMRYDEIISLLREKGFTNIVENPIVIEFDLYKESKCTEISIGEESNFSASDKFNPDDKIMITYFTGALASAPDDWSKLLDKHYEDVKKQFEDAGFTNITCVPYETDYNEENVSEGSVKNIAIGPTGSICTFAKGEQWFTVVEIRIDYRVKPTSKPEPTPQPTSKPAPEPTSEPVNRGGNYSEDDVEGGTGVTVPSHEETVGNLVWVPTNGGKKYHSRSGCSNMKDPMQVTLETAIENGYTACKRCH